MNPETKIRLRLDRMTTEELREVNTYVVALIKGRRKADAVVMRATLSVGDRVSYDGRNGYTEGTVTKVNRTKCIVRADGDPAYQTWNVPMSMLTKLQPDPFEEDEAIVEATFNPETGVVEGGSTRAT